ncbi:MAG: response regulator [Balneolaceae bacterium]|nr:response regulator [Balneolaceae bacterium]
MDEEKYTLLVVDDDEAIHLMVKSLMRDDYELIHAYNAQEGIDALSENPVHFILTDIHMEGMTGIEFLESLTKDKDKKDIPVLVMTSLPTQEKEQTALDFGAADFIKKELFYENLEAVAERIRAKLVSNITVPDLPEELKLSRKEISRKMLFEVANGDFLSASQVLFRELGSQLNLDHLSFWVLNNDKVHMILANGVQPPASYGPEEFKKEPDFDTLTDKKRPYMTNHIFKEGEPGILKDLSREEGLAAEIGIPLFALTEKEYINNKMKIPPTTPLFGYIFLKRKKLFSTKEYKLTTVMVMQLGTILWRLYKNM